MRDGSTHRRDQHKPRRGMAVLVALALLVLLALIGAAYVATARIDRGSSAQHVAGTQVDLLLDGAWNITQGRLLADLVDAKTGAYRPAGDLNHPVAYNHWTCATADEGGGLLAERVPSVVNGVPRWPAISAPLRADTFVDPAQDAAQNTYTERTDLLPDSVQVNGQLYPALKVNGHAYVAADTDGDGIADAGLWPLDAGRSGGITWYAAARIVDNSAAVNASLAWKPNDPSAALPGNFFPTNVDLQGLLAGGAAEMASLNAFRFNAPASLLAPRSDNGGVLGGFSFASPFDALWTQLGRRLDTPGYNTSSTRYRAPGAEDQIALARGRLASGRQPSTPFNTLLPQSMAAGLRAAPYSPDQVALWAADRFNFDSRAFSRQSILSTSNPVSTAIQPHEQTGKLASLFKAPYPQAPGKTSVNTASFEVLWRTFWNVMCDSSETTIFGAAGSEVFNPYIAKHPQRMFRSPLRDVRFSDPTKFDATTQRMEPFQVLLLRAALAAANAIDIRDGDRDITSRHFPLTARIDGQEREVDVTVYGAEPQVYITEIFAHTDTHTPGGAAQQPNARGYVAVELHNPFPFDISLRNWTLGLVDRHPGQASFSIQPLGGFDGFPGDVIVPAKGYLVLENYASAGSGSATYRPRSSGLPAEGTPVKSRARFVCVKDLDRVIEGQGSGGGELVLLRPRRADGTLTAGEGFDESHLADRVPVDQFDFTGLKSSAGSTAYVIWHYSRASGDAQGNAWRFVYPGKYDGTKSTQRQEGTECTQVLDPGGEPTAPVANLGEFDPGTYTNPYPPIQLATMGLGASTASSFPFGGFARVGDILHVPFIGGYRIREAGASGRFLALNAVTMDSAFADDGDSEDDAQEALGRFVPIMGDGAERSPRTPHDPIDWSAHSASENGVAKVYQNMVISPPVNTKGMHIGCVEEWGWVPRSVTIRNVEVHDVYRDSYGDSLGLHLDCIQIQMDGDNQKIKTDVLIENVYCHDTNVESCNIQDGRFGLIHIKNLKLKNAKSAKIYVMNSGSVDKILIENSPGLHIFVQGRRYISPDGIERYTGDNVGPIVVKNSPGAVVNGPGLNVTYVNDQVDAPDIAADDYGTDPAAWRYHFAMKLFDYFTVLGAQEDSYPLNGGSRSGGVAAVGMGSAPAADEAFAMQGLVNVNTAPWRVLAAVPMLPDPKDNAELAKAIVAYRTARGPFTSLFELNQIVSSDDASRFFRNGWGKLDYTRTLTAAQGDLSPADGVAGDWEKSEMMVTRLSNLLTTRSDSFTVYLAIQGWRNAGTPQAELVTQRRGAWIVDRSGVTSKNKVLRSIPVPMD